LESCAKAPGEKPGASDKGKADDKAKGTAPAPKVKAGAARDDEPPEPATTPDDDASLPAAEAAKKKRLRPPRGPAHNKPGGPEEEPATLKDLLKLPER